VCVVCFLCVWFVSSGCARAMSAVSAGDVSGSGVESEEKKKMHTVTVVKSGDKKEKEMEKKMVKERKERLLLIKWKKVGQKFLHPLQPL